MGPLKCHIFADVLTDLFSASNKNVNIGNKLRIFTLIPQMQNLKLRLKLPKPIRANSLISSGV